MSDDNRPLPKITASVKSRSVSSAQAFDMLRDFLTSEQSKVSHLDLPHYEDLCNVSESLVTNDEQRVKLTEMKSHLRKANHDTVGGQIDFEEKVEADEPPVRSKVDKKAKKKAEKEAKKAAKKAKKTAKKEKKAAKKRKRESFGSKSS